MRMWEKDRQCEKEAKQTETEAVRNLSCLQADKSAADSVQVIHAPLGHNATKTSAQTARQASKTDPWLHHNSSNIYQ